MEGWIQIPLETGEELNVKKQVKCRMINADKIDELFLDVSGQNACITALKDGKEETLCEADPESATRIWLKLVHSLSAETVDFTGDHKAHPVNYAFPKAGVNDVAAIVNTFLIKTGEVHVDEELKDSERLFLFSLFGYICSSASAQEQNMEMLNTFLNYYEIRDGDAEFKNAIDMLFDEREKEDPNCREVSDYKKFKQLSLSKQKRVLKSCIGRMECLGFRSELKDTEDASASWGDCCNW